jgi:hypothetical protein
MQRLCCLVPCFITVQLEHQQCQVQALRVYEDAGIKTLLSSIWL